MENAKDQLSGRPLIEGKGSPINSGVFRRSGYPGIVADLDGFKKFDWFSGVFKLMMETEKDLLGLAAAAAKEYLPINIESDTEFKQQFGKTDRYNLSSFALTATEVASGKCKSPPIHKLCL